MGTIGKTFQAGYNRFSFIFLAGIKGRIKGWEQLSRQQPSKHKPENPSRYRKKAGLLTTR